MTLRMSFLSLVLATTLGCNVDFKPATENQRAHDLSAVTDSVVIETGDDPASVHQPGSMKLPYDEQFTFDLLGKLAAGQPRNLIFSPASISTALAMTAAGASGLTRDEMLKTLRVKSEGDLHADYGRLLATLKADKPGHRLFIANRLWAQENYALLPDFLDATRKDYGAAAVPLDFAGNSESARAAINGWIEKQTRNKIQDLIPPGALTPSTRLVLTNAIYFQGDWALPFNEQLTLESRFHVTDQKVVETPFMTQRDSFPFVATDGVKLLSMGYEGDELAMVVILPDRLDGLAEVESRLSEEQLSAWISMFETQEVNVSLPKFRIMADYELRGPLSALGMPSAFSAADADFTGMTGSRDLYLTNVIHKAYIDVHEKGTEAAAATAVIGAPSSAPVQTVASFRADHPFLFVIRHQKTGAILFAGRVVNPRT